MVFWKHKGKCHLIVSNNEHVRTLKLDDTGIENINCKNVLSRVAPYINVTKRRLLINSFFGSRFHYYPLAWMSYHRNVSNKINPLHEKYLRIVNGGSGSSFEDLLDKDISVPIHVKNVHSLAIKIFKISKNLFVSIAYKVFEKRNNAYNLRKLDSQCISWSRKYLIP